MRLSKVKNMLTKLRLSPKKKITPHPQYYEHMVQFTMSRDPNTGIYGLDINPKYGMVLWVIPGSPAERIGIFPRDLIVYIDDIYIQPNDTWYYDYLLEHDTVSITIVPTKLVFPNPLLIPRIINTTKKYGDKIYISQECVNTLPIQTEGIPLDKLDLQTLQTMQILQSIQNVRYSEVQMEDRVYI